MIDVPTTDTPTHRFDILQLQIKDIATHLEQVRTKRATIAEKIAKVKNNNAITREALVNNKLKKLLNNLEKSLTALDSDIDDINEKLNNGRALFYELSDGVVVYPKE